LREKGKTKNKSLDVFKNFSKQREPKRTEGNAGNFRQAYFSSEIESGFPKPENNMEKEKREARPRKDIHTMAKQICERSPGFCFQRSLLLLLLLGHAGSDRIKRKGRANASEQKKKEKREEEEEKKLR
jgi:hypothetical protein